MQYDHINEPVDGVQIFINDGHTIDVPGNRNIPLIEGDGIGNG